MLRTVSAALLTAFIATGSQAHPTGYGHTHVTSEQCRQAEMSGLFRCIDPRIEVGKDGPNQRQNRQVRDVANRLGLDNDERTMLHKEVHGWDYSYDEILQLARDMFGK